MVKNPYDPKDDDELEDEFDEDEDWEDFEEEDEDFADIEWDVREEPIRKWLEDKLDADHDGWAEDGLPDTPIFDTEAEISEIVDTVPLNWMGLKEQAAFYIDALDGDVIVFFDDRSKENVVTDEAYQDSIKRKIDKISKDIGEGWTRVMREINIDEVDGKGKITRVAWTSAKIDDDEEDLDIDFEADDWEDDEDWDQEDWDQED